MRGLESFNGGSRLTRRPLLGFVSPSCLARSRLCKAKASSGDSSGGASPATWWRGDRTGAREDAWEAARRSRGSGGWLGIMNVRGESVWSRIPCGLRESRNASSGRVALQLELESSVACWNGDRQGGVDRRKGRYMSIQPKT